jgi:hypothetical protein
LQCWCFEKQEMQSSSQQSSISGQEGLVHIVFILFPEAQRIVGLR